MGTKYKSASIQPATVSQTPIDCKSMRCWSFVYSIAVLRINAPFPPFSMPSSNLIGFGNWRHLTFRRNCFRVSYLFIYYENHTQSGDKKEKTRNTLVNAKHPLVMPEGNFALYLSSNSEAVGNGCMIHCINTFPCYCSTFKRHALLS